MKTSELTGCALDWAVAKCDGASADTLESYIDGMREADDGNYSTNWSQGGPIIEREFINLTAEPAGWNWIAEMECGIMYGATPLIAAMRCFVASRLGDEVEIPKELVCEQ